MLTPGMLAIAQFMAAVGPESISVETRGEPFRPGTRPALRRPYGVNYCGCGRRISANRGLCLSCAEMHLAERERDAGKA